MMKNTPKPTVVCDKIVELSGVVYMDDGRVGFMRKMK